MKALSRNLTIMTMALAVTGALFPVTSARSQGVIPFANNSFTALTNGLTRERLPVGGPFLVALYVAPAGSAESDFFQVAGPIRMTGGPGLFNGGMVSVPLILPGTTILVQVRAWDSTYGDNYLTAAANPQALIGRSNPINITVSPTPGPGIGLPAAGFKGFCLYSADCLDIHCPSEITVLADCSNGASGVPVNYVVTGNNACTGRPISVINCSPPSGSIFANGTTTLVTCTVTDLYGRFKSCMFNVTVASVTPYFTLPPRNLTTTPGGSVTFSATATGPAPLSYQWAFNGSSIAGATSSTLTIPSATEASEGIYTVTVSTSCGTTSTASGSLTVLNSPTSNTLIPTGAMWRYRFDGAPPDSRWRTPDFIETGWSAGRAQLGFGDGDETTVIGGASNRFITAYFRRPFLRPLDPAKTNLFIALRRDDGAIVHLNGTEIFRSNMHTGAVDYLTLASGSDPSDGNAVHTAPLPSFLLRPGTNTLAIEVHQHDVTSSDLSFDLRLQHLPILHPTLRATRSGTNVVVSWANAEFRLQSATNLAGRSTNTLWMDLPNSSPALFPAGRAPLFYRLVWP